MMKTNRTYLRGDLLKVWSLQSFFGGGFIDGKLARVKQDSTNNSVLVIVERKTIITDKSADVIDLSYEVYCKQTKFIRHGTKEEIENIEYHTELNYRIRQYEQHAKHEQGKPNLTTPFHYAPEFFFDENTLLQLNRDLLEYPEMFI